MANKKDKSTEKLLLIIGVISTITGIISNISQLIESKWTLVFLIAGLALVTIYIFVNKRKKAHGDKKTFISIGMGLILVISLILSLFLLNIFPGQCNKCLFSSQLTAIGISKFDNEDNFSSLVYEFLKEENLPVTIFEIKKIDKDYFKCISDSNFYKSFDSLCISSGMIVSGKRSATDELFYCKIRLLNFNNIIDRNSTNNELITLRNPNIQEFSIDYQAQILVDFIMAIISYSQWDFEKAEKLFNLCINQNKNSSNNKFLAICHAYLGNIYYTNDNSGKAIQEYLKASELNGTDDVFKNLVNYYTGTGDYYKAKKYYNKIHNKSEANLEDVKEKLKLMEKNLKNLKNPINVADVIQIPPSGTLHFYDIDSTKLTIKYSSIIQFDFNNRTFFIYKSDNELFGIFDSHGVLIKLPEYQELLDAKDYLIDKFK